MPLESEARDNRPTNEEDSGKQQREISVTDSGEAFLELLAANDVRFVFFNSGSDVHPILEHLSKFELLGKSPRSIFTLYEQTALNMAHGYSMISHTAQAVMVHVGVGTLNLGGALHNAYRGRAPVLIVAGRSPFSFENELPEGRVYHNQWDQELYDQAGSVREYTKWEYELKTNVNLHHVVNRALQVANTEPQGPVYLILPRELLAEQWEEKQRKLKIPPAARWKAPKAPQVDPSSLEKIARILAEAENPIVITEYVGRNESAVHSLVQIVEALGLGVLESQRNRMNFPTNHSQFLHSFPKEALEEADAIFVLDSDVPWIPSKHKLRADVKICQIDIDPLKSGVPVWGFPVDVGACGSSDIALPAMLSIVERKMGNYLKTRRAVISERKEKLGSKHDEIRRALDSAIASSTPMKPEWLVARINKIKRDDCIIMSEAVSNMRAVEDYITLIHPGTFFIQGGGSLGDGLGNSLGLKLAAENRDVICLVSDGAFVYSNPIAVFWTAIKYNIPVLVVIIDNGGYASMKGSIDTLYPQGWSKKNNYYSGVRIDPRIDYIAAAGSCGVSGWKVESPEELDEVLGRALSETRQGKPAVVDALVQQV